MNQVKKSLAQRLYSGDVSFDFVGRAKLWYLISAIMIAASILVLSLKGLTLGIEFRGGADFQAPATVTSSTPNEVRDVIDELGLPDMESVTVLTVGDSAIRVQTRSLSTEEVTQVRSALASYLDVDSEEVAYSLIGASWGDQVTKQAGIALVVFLFLVLGMIWIYFRDWKMSIAAIVALFHDMIITVGVYALIGFTVTPATLIGVLTILGYSLYDTVVVFDKVRENVNDLVSRNRTYSEAANLAVNQTLIRSINTTIIGVLPVAALLIAGTLFLPTGPLVDLGLALFVGMLAGAYSSIFIATPLLANMKEREPAMIAHRERIAKRAKKAEQKAKVTIDLADEDDLADAEVALSANSSARRQPTRHTSRAQRKGK